MTLLPEHQPLTNTPQPQTRVHTNHAPHPLPLQWLATSLHTPLPLQWQAASLCSHTPRRSHAHAPGLPLSVKLFAGNPIDEHGRDTDPDNGTWLKHARNEIKMLGSVMGLEHKAERPRALEQIEKAHEADNDVWPESYCCSLCHELKAAWVEELREGHRKLCRLLNSDNPRKEDLKFVALAPASWLQVPRHVQPWFGDGLLSDGVVSDGVHAEAGKGF